MISDISKALNDGIFLSDVFLSLDGIHINDDNLELTIQATYEDNNEKLQLWKVICSDFRDHKLNVNYFEEFIIQEDHVYLWNYNNNSAELFFKGTCKNINKVISDLFTNHFNIVNGQSPLEKYININYYTADLWHLLKQGEGLFSKGPINLIKVYKKILSSNGYKTSIIEFPITESTPYKILLFGDSYVVAKSFQTMRIL